ncbi:hypothetical protein FOL47_006643 [Perkinsus chesapeaki]|uniref:subtilisin n=1 Tax=Perkinsus chesapeaki TaxID=330153 RepID=A0A7J6LQD2_PERCH|nr:hypothetical protein FOL47_006643 [Perkinsus chesapeaki]
MSFRHTVPFLDTAKHLNLFGLTVIQSLFLVALSAPSEDVLFYPPNDPYFEHQRVLFEALHINETWMAVRESGLDRRDVIVTVIDTGVKEMPDLEGKLLKGLDVSGAPEPSVEDLHGHGTAMAAIIAAGINNDIDGTGIADKVKIRPIRIMASSPFAGLPHLKKGWKKAMTYKDSDIILLAFVWSYTNDDSLLFKALLEKAVKKGKFVVIGASNPNHQDGYGAVAIPCSLANSMPGVVCVTATFTSNPHLLLSNSSLLASFGLPGTDVLIPTLEQEGDERKYKTAKGSSLAAAIVAGVAALMQSFGKFEPDEMKTMLLEATKDIKTKINQGTEIFRENMEKRQKPEESVLREAKHRRCCIYRA